MVQRYDFDAVDVLMLRNDADGDYVEYSEYEKTKQQRDDLLEACDKVRDWLDTSSLQQILVHYTEDKRRHALIMGIASHLERLEAAIAKVTRKP